MRACGKCNGVLRWDERLELVQFTGLGAWHYCPGCAAEERGEDRPPPRTYPKGSRVPRHPRGGDGDMPICGLCRKALHEDDVAEPMRLQAEDVAGTEYEGVVEANDCYVSCRECRQRFTPSIARRLKRLGIIGEAVPDRQVRRNMLL